MITNAAQLVINQYKLCIVCLAHHVVGGPLLFTVKQDNKIRKHDVDFGWSGLQESLERK